jgi:hypothetical protein
MPPQPRFHAFGLLILSLLTTSMTNGKSQIARFLPQGPRRPLKGFRNIFDGSLAFRMLPQFLLILCRPLPTYDALHLPAITVALSHSSLPQI